MKDKEELFPVTKKLKIKEHRAWPQNAADDILLHHTSEILSFAVKKLGCEI